MLQTERKNHLIDATGQSLGRLASQIAVILSGKNKINYTPHLDQGDSVTVENVEQIKFSGNKLSHKIYYRHSTHPGGLKKTNLQAMLGKHGHAHVLRQAVYGMLPANKLRKTMLKRLIIK